MKNTFGPNKSSRTNPFGKFKDSYLNSINISGVYYFADEITINFYYHVYTFWKNHVIHRDGNKPAVIRNQNEFEWYFEGKRHRIDGAAIIRLNYKEIKSKIYANNNPFIYYLYDQEFKKQQYMLNML